MCFPELNHFFNELDPVIITIQQKTWNQNETKMKDKKL